MIKSDSEIVTLSVKIDILKRVYWKEVAFDALSVVKVV